MTGAIGATCGFIIIASFGSVLDPRAEILGAGWFLTLCAGAGLGYLIGDK
jgi:hypothetical protein